MANIHSATEDEIGRLHKLITACHNLKAGTMLEAAEQLVNDGYEPADIALVINSRDLASMQKWVEYNGVGCQTAEADEESELSKRLKELRNKQTGKVIALADIIDAREAEG